MQAKVESPKRESVVASGPPLDYSFKELKNCAEIEVEEPRGGFGRSSPEDAMPDAPGEITAAGTNSAVTPHAFTGALSPQGLATRTGVPHGTRQRFFVRVATTSVRLNNNLLESVDGLPKSLESALSDPLTNIQWLDLSFNMLQTVEPELLRFQSLKTLYLHGNRIKSIPAVERLRKLPSLLSLTLNGNPIEIHRYYRHFTIGALPQLKTLDHTSITGDERVDANVWFKGHLLRKKKRRELAEEAAFDEDL
mmetsp:Transcript_120537/g.239949  ORF Transcript_120537/g.239949 Transcript_120537/m.239949 type:complete len:251 (+) Transcript_120537:117-869(+)